MNRLGSSAPHIAIACGGTGGHLFPGLAVAEQLVQRECAVTLLISPKEVDQQAVKQATGVEVLTLPAVGLTRGRGLAFARGFSRSYRSAKRAFVAHRPQAALAMGGFTSAPPLLAARRLGAHTFLHESNTIPGRANRWLSWLVHRAFVGFPSAAARLHARNALVTGTPVRSQFGPRDAAACRSALGLDPDRPVMLVMGGSQGASGINELVLQTLPVLTRTASNWQWFHLSGLNDEEKVRKDYAAAGLKAAVHSFFSEMETAMGAATAAVSRAGASSLAELAAARLPAVLVPYPAATDNHQFHNAREFERTGAARLLEQKHASPDRLAHLLMDLVQNAAVREQVKTALVQWHSPRAAQQIAESILAQVADVRAQARVGNAGKPGHLKSDRGGDANATALQSNCADRAELAPAFERGDTYKSGRRPRPPLRLREILR
jgi:UDP-N-acetylglucosamine--N-acetylmuramyl-(pentapeptide) pyrophosphoryl-undecaprenol N-acetylglucosamine transferase